MPASAPSSRALLLATDPSAFQFVPPFVEYHHVPLLVSAAVIAIPVSAPLSASVTLSTCPAGEEKSTRLETSVPTAPEGAPESSFCAVNAGLLTLSSTGAVFRGRSAMASYSSPPALKPTSDPCTSSAAVPELVPVPVAVTVSTKMSYSVTLRLFVPTVSAALSEISNWPLVRALPPSVALVCTSSRP